MPDDRNDWLDPDNEAEAALRFLVENTDLSPLQAKDVVDKHGTDRAKLIEVAKTIKAEG